MKRLPHRAQRFRRWLSPRLRGARRLLAVVVVAAAVGLLTSWAAPRPQYDPEAWPLLESFTSPLPGTGRHEGHSLSRQAQAVARDESSAQAPLPPSFDFIWPAEGAVVQGMGPAHPSGIDIGLAFGDPVRVVRDGQVTFAGGDACCEYGYYVVVEHDGGWSSLYGHLSSIAVKKGAQVKQGQLVGRAGDTGHASGPHLHFELRLFGAPVNPGRYLQPWRYVPPAPALVSAQTAPTPLGPPPAPSPTERAANANGSGLSGPQAVALAAEWLASADASYEVDATSCVAVPLGPNWSVVCQARLDGCETAVCATTLRACVYEQPLLVSRSCP